MSKKVLVLAGSPRKGGNSDLLCGAFMKGAREAGHETEKIYVDDLKLGGCKACYACRGTGKCFQQDGMAQVLEKMIAADVIVLATPVYFYSLSGQLKILIDRTLPGYTKIRDKDFYFIAAAAAGKAMLERTMDAIRCADGCAYARYSADLRGLRSGTEFLCRGAKRHIGNSKQSDHLR